MARDTSSSTTRARNTIQVIDVKTWKATASWPLAPCEGPTGIAYDKATDRIFSGCNKTSVVVNASTARSWPPSRTARASMRWGGNPSRKLIYIPNGGEGNVTVVHQDSADKYSVVATVATFAGAKTIAVDPTTHTPTYSSPSEAQRRFRLLVPRHRQRAAAAVGPGAHHGGVVHRHQVITGAVPWQDYEPRPFDCGPRVSVSELERRALSAADEEEILADAPLCSGPWRAHWPVVAPATLSRRLSLN